MARPEVDRLPFGQWPSDVNHFTGQHSALPPDLKVKSCHYNLESESLQSLAISQVWSGTHKFVNLSVPFVCFEGELWETTY